MEVLDDARFINIAGDRADSLRLAEAITPIYPINGLWYSFGGAAAFDHVLETIRAMHLEYQSGGKARKNPPGKWPVRGAL